MTEPILQLLPAPYTIDPQSFADAYSAANPSGDYRTAYQLRTLIDPVPSLSRAYQPSGSSTETVYGEVVNGATALEAGSFVVDQIRDAQASFAGSALENVTGLPGTWRALQAEPSNWMEPSATGFRSVTVDPKTLEISGLAGLFRMLGGASSAPPPEGIDSLSLEILQVDISRNWFDMALFESGGWTLLGQRRGFVSTGTVANNRGVLPLLITGFLVGRSILATRFPDFTPDLDGSATIGPFPIMTSASAQALLEADPPAPQTTSDPKLYLIGFVSTLITISPRKGGRHVNDEST